MARKRERIASNHTILVVDDQEEILISVKTLLEREGHDVLTAPSAAEALELFRCHDIHLLLVDYFMPRMNGEELIREVRNFDPYVQIILQTGYSGEKPARQMMDELDIQGYHDKAEGPDKLLLWIDVALKAHRLVREMRDGEVLQRELVANVSHEFRTPLNIILGYSDLLMEGDFGELPAEAIEALGRLTGATNDLSALVSDLLSYAKLEAGGTETNYENVETQSVAQELERLAGLFLESKPVDFRVEFEAAPLTFFTDSGKLRVILRNLVSNAAKFTTSGEVAVKVAKRDGNVVFEVSDTGPGILDEHHDVIFDPFRQINGSATRLHRGIGLGLALSRKLAHLLSADIKVQSEYGKGATFAVTLPYVPAVPVGGPMRRHGAAMQAHAA